MNQLEQKISDEKESLLQSVTSFRAGEITKEDLIAQDVDFQNQKIELETELKRIENQFKKRDKYYKNRYFNYPSRRSLMWSLGLGIIISILSLRYMQKVFELNALEKETGQKTDNDKKWADTLESFIGAIVGGYFFAWILDPVDRLDLPYGWYILLTVLLGVIGAFIGYFYTKARHNKISVLKEKISFLQKTVESLFKLQKAKK